MLNTTEREGLQIHTTDDPQHITKAVVEGPEGLFLVDTVEEPYTESEGAAYNREDFLDTVLDYYRAGRRQPIESVSAAFGR